MAGTPVWRLKREVGARGYSISSISMPWRSITVWRGCKPARTSQTCRASIQRPSGKACGMRPPRSVTDTRNSETLRMAAWSRIMFESMVEPQRPVPTMNTGWILRAIESVSPSSSWPPDLSSGRRCGVRKHEGGLAQHSGVPADVFRHRGGVHAVARLPRLVAQCLVAVSPVKQASATEVRLVKAEALFDLLLDPLHSPCVTDHDRQPQIEFAEDHPGHLGRRRGSGIGDVEHCCLRLRSADAHHLACHHVYRDQIEQSCRFGDHPQLGAGGQAVLDSIEELAEPQDAAHKTVKA